MPKLSPEFKEAIGSLPSQELLKIIFRFSKRNQEIYDSLVYEYVNGPDPAELFEETKGDIQSFLFYLPRGTIQKQLAKGISKGVQSINSFSKITKDEKLEADLLLFLLKIVFDNYSDHLGTCWTVFDSRLAITTIRLYNLVKNKLHHDYWNDYREDMNRFMKTLKKNSSHINCVFAMDEKFEE